MTGLLVFLLCLLLLAGGYCLYARFAERVYGPDLQSPMPCDTKADGVDYVRMPTWRVFLIQLLNIAGLGPVFGALSGALFGPVALLWIVLGCIFAGGMHDFLTAHMSADNGGENLPETVGRILGRSARLAMRVICVLIALLVGVVFTKGPADMLHANIGGFPAIGWAALIFGYYFLATVLPIHVIIGRFYPVFGALFLFMALGMGIMLPFSGHDMLPELNPFRNAHPQGISPWPMLFVTSCCGAISGFHATQNPMMVRCLGSRQHMRRVFYGAMVMEGVIALIWATVGLTLRELPTDNPAAAAGAACTALLGEWGGLLAMLGIVVLAITSGDTALRTCRLILADALHMEQKSIRKRLALTIPLFAAVILLANIDFSIVWRYCGWATQCLACLTLWSLAVLLRRRGRLHGIATLPALFMTAMCGTYILHAPEGLGQPLLLSSCLGLMAAAGALLLFCRRSSRA